MLVDDLSLYEGNAVLLNADELVFKLRPMNGVSIEETAMDLARLELGMRETRDIDEIDRSIDRSIVRCYIRYCEVLNNFTGTN